MRVNQASGRRLAATATVLGFGGLIVAVGLIAGFGLWFAAALAGGLLGALGTLLVIGMTGATAAPAGPSPRTGLDPTSGLLSAERLHEDLAAELASPTGYGVAIHVCALHGLGQYNDAYGEACGDAMIGWLARRLRDSVGERGHVYRMRGASFAVLAGLGDSDVDLTAVCGRALLEVGDVLL